MSVRIPTQEPTVFTAGNTVKWTKSLPDYAPEDGWVLSYAFVINGGLKTVTATDNGDGSHLVTISASESISYLPDVYHWQAHAAKGPERYPVGTGRLEVKPDFASQSTGYDARSHVKKVLDALEATILKKASKDQMSYTIAGRSLGKMSPTDLLKWQNHYKILYKQELDAERLNNGGSLSNQGRVRF